MKRYFRIIALFLFAALCLSGLSGCTKQTQAFTESRFDCFDTFSTLTVYTDSEAQFEAYLALFDEELVRYHQLLDIYHSYEGIHNLKTINDAAGEAVTVCPELIAFFEFAKEAYTVTGGLTNIALGGVTALWHDAREVANAHPESAALPDEARLTEALAHTDLNCLVLTEDTVRLTDPHLSLDAGALGKGYVAQVIAEALTEAGCDSFLINLGGNTVAYGQKPQNTPWRVRIEIPPEVSELSSPVIELRDMALVTSGTYHRYFTVGETRYHHVIDPNTGYPTDTCLSVSVLCADAALADAMSTALLCLSVEEGLALVETLEGIEAFWILPDGTTRQSTGFDAYEGDAP